jgi:hypothetical protein
MAQVQDRSAARTRVIIIVVIVAVGAYLYLRYRKQEAAKTASAPNAAAAQGQTQDASVPVLNIAGSGTYQGPYTPYNVINNGVQQPSGVFPGNPMQSIADALQNGNITLVTNTNKAGG